MRKLAFLAGMACTAAMVSPVLAAVPSIDALAGEVAGVLGSGDQLSLRLRAGPGEVERTVRVGEAVVDGWVLSALDPTAATFSREGQTRRIGLNPTGALAGAADPAKPSQVTVIGYPPEMQAIMRMSEAEVLAQATPAELQRLTQPIPPLNAEESRRLALYRIKRRLMTPVLNAAVAPWLRAAPNPGLLFVTGPWELARALGPDYVELENRTNQVVYQQDTAAYERALALGITSVTLQPGETSPAQALSRLGMQRLRLVAGPPGSNSFVVQAPSPPESADQVIVTLRPITPDMPADVATSLRQAAQSTGVIVGPFGPIDRASVVIR